jgi:BRCT domain type II-containing protein
MPTERTVDLTVVPTATKYLRTKAVSAAICITVTVVSQQQTYKHSHHSTSSSSNSQLKNSRFITEFIRTTTINI